MFKFIIQFTIFFLLWWSNKKAKGRWLTCSSVLLGIYMVCSLMGIFELGNGDYRLPYDSYYWFPLLEFDLFLLAFLLPFRIYNESSIDRLKLPSLQFLNAFSTIVIILSFYSILFFAGSVRNIMSMSDLGAARNTHNAGEMYFEAGIMATIATVSAANYVFAIVLYFIYKVIGGANRRCLLLLISSLSRPISVLAFVGRDGIVFWIFTFVFCYAFFRQYMPKQMRKQTLKPLFVAGGLFAIPFLLISISRFGSSYEGGTGASFVSYLGHAFIQGPLFFGIPDKPITPGAVFPLFYEITGMSRPVAMGGGMVGEWVSWKFSTFVVSLYASLDLRGLIITVVLMFLFFYITTGRAKTMLNMGQFTIYLLYFEIIGEGVFYFCHATRGGNLFIVTTLLLSIILSISSKQSNGIVLQKIE